MLQDVQPMAATAMTFGGSGTRAAGRHTWPRTGRQGGRRPWSKALHKIGLVAATAWGLSSLALLAATITEHTLSLPGLAGKPAAIARTIRLTGPIEQGDTERLRSVLIDIQRKVPRALGRPLTTAELSSVGGDLLEGMKLGYLFREFDIATLVRAGDSCLSACALAFLGGTASHSPAEFAVQRDVEVGATLGFHNFSLNPASDLAAAAGTSQEGVAKGFNAAKGGAALLVHYAASLGVDPAFVARMLGRPPDVWEYAQTAGQFIDLKMCPRGLTQLPPSPRTSAVNICNNSLGMGMASGPVDVRRLSRTEAKRHLLEHIHKNVASFSVSGPLATELAALLASRDDRLIDSVYADFRAAGLPLPDIIGPTFEVSGYGAGIYALRCIASVSLDNLDSFDVVLEGPMGLARPPQKPATACGRLFSFERDDIVNPERK